MKLADTQAIAIFLRRPASTIRRWAREGHLTRHGTDKQGRTLYDIDEAERLLHAEPAPEVDKPPDLREQSDTDRGSVP